MPTPATAPVLPAWVTAEVMADTRAVWEPLYGRPLSDAEVGEILYHTDGLLRVLFDLKGRVSSRACRPQEGDAP